MSLAAARAVDQKPMKHFANFSDSDSLLRPVSSGTLDSAVAAFSCGLLWQDVSLIR